MSHNYIDSKASQNELKIAELLTFLPKFCHDYIISISGFTKPLTQLAHLQRIQFSFTGCSIIIYIFQKNMIISEILQ